MQKTCISVRNSFIAKRDRKASLKTLFSDQTTYSSTNCHTIKELDSGRKNGKVNRQVSKSAEVFKRHGGRVIKLSQFLKSFCILLFVSACSPQNGAVRSSITVICNCGTGVIVRGRGESLRAGENAAQEKCHLISRASVTKCKPVK